MKNIATPTSQKNNSSILSDHTKDGLDIGGQLKFYHNLGKLIREKRLKHPKKFTQAEISKFLGDPEGHLISDIERGLRDIPVEVIAELRNVLGITQEEIELARHSDDNI
jgi:hypothetical protein